MILYSIFSSQMSSRRSRELCTVKLEYWEYMRRLFSVELQARILFFKALVFFFQKETIHGHDLASIAL